MPIPRKPCKYCEESNPKHWPYQCRDAPKVQRNIKKRGKHATRWSKTRKQWFEDNKAESYTCYLCGKYLNPIETTLDHVIPRSRAPHLRYEMFNLKPCCYLCNSEKGSKVYEDY